MRDQITARVTKLIRNVNRRVHYSQRIRGKKVKIPLIWDLHCGMSEKWMVDVLEFVLPESEGAFLDVGANVGQTLVKLRSLDARRRYIGFEPNPACVFYLGELITMNGYANCTLLPVGLFTDTAMLGLNLFIATSGDAAASLIQDFRPGERIVDTKYVPVFSFERVAHLLQLDKLGVVKIDVEGAEVEVVRSLQSEIAKHRPIVLTEVLPPYSADNTARIERQNQLAQIFASLDYTIFRVRQTQRGEYRGLEALEAFDIHGDLTLCDYVLVPRERAERIRAAGEHAARAAAGDARS